MISFIRTCSPRSAAPPLRLSALRLCALPMGLAKTVKWVLFVATLVPLPFAAPTDGWRTLAALYPFYLVFFGILGLELRSRQARQKMIKNTKNDKKCMDSSVARTAHDR